MFQRIITFFERQSFGVSTYLAEKFNMQTSKVRLFFIYSSFIAVGLPILCYLLAALMLDIRKYMRKSKTGLWDI
ncbi:MAG: PspC family transcriptional regulator [Pedobacter sp.]|nr:MAG: PspC family transcriptional regulator [Pedobacter sp.]